MDAAPLAQSDVASCLVEFVDYEQFFFFAGVCRAWKEAWGQRPPTTRAVTEDTTVAQLSQNLQCGLPLIANVCTAVAKLDRLDLLQCARHHGCAWNEVTCIAAAGGGHLELLRWCRDNGCTWDWRTCASAAEGNHLEVLQYARGNGCDWNKYTCSRAAWKGHLATLQWARANGCAWSAETCSSATDGGHLEVLRWCRENGCSWDEGVCSRAASKGFLHIIRLDDAGAATFVGNIGCGSCRCRRYIVFVATFCGSPLLFKTDHVFGDRYMDLCLWWDIALATTRHGIYPKR